MHDNFIIVENKYGKYAIIPSSQHRAVARRITQGDVWEPLTLNYIRDLNLNKAIIHAGAFFGDFLPPIKTFYPDLEIYAFEPGSINYLALLKTIELNKLTNIKTYNLALGATNSEVNLYVGKDGEQGGVTRVVPRKTNFSEVIKQVTLDEIIPKDILIGLIHLDIENYECEALKGSLSLIKKNKPVLILEKSEYLEKNEWFKKFLKEYRYTFDIQIHGNLAFKPY